MAEHSGLPRCQREWFQHGQALEDAIAYRTAHAASPCSACQHGGGQRCDEHARDLDLIAEYRQALIAVGQKLAAFGAWGFP
jgi:hypothetical protein